MKKSIYLTALYLSLLILLSSCFTTVQSHTYAKTEGKKVPIQNLDCSTTTPEDVDVFYEGDSLSFNYKKIGFVTAHGEQQIPDSLIINRLKYNSYLLCGNGVTEVVKSNILINNYTYKQFSANSVRIEKDSTYYNQYPPQNDFSFYHFSKNDITTSTEYTKFNPGLTLLSFAATITVVIIKALNPSDDNDEPDYEEEDYDYWDDEDDDGWE